MIAPAHNDGHRQLVLVDIGNTHVAMARWSDGSRGPVVRVATDPLAPVVDRLQQEWDELPSTSSRAVVISSVCPPALSRLRAMCGSRGIDPLLAIGEEIEAPITADLPDPSKVGTDRLCVAAAAYAIAKQACVVADFGTALTIDLIADNGVFLGGTIMPGIALAARALHEHTAQLPEVEVGAPTEILGKDTRSAIRNGIFAMMVGTLREVTERYATEIGKWPPLIVTGGDGEAIARAADFVDRVVPELCLDGILLAYQLHTELQEEP